MLYFCSDIRRLAEMREPSRLPSDGKSRSDVGRAYLAKSHVEYWAYIKKSPLHAHIFPYQIFIS